MRPSSFRSSSSSSEDLEYDKELEKRRKSYISEISEVMAKLKGGSLQGNDKKDIAYDIIDEIIKWEVISRADVGIHLFKQISEETKNLFAKK